MPEFHQGEVDNPNMVTPGGGPGEANFQPGVDPGEIPDLPPAEYDEDLDDETEVQTGPGAIAAVVVGVLLLGAIAYSSVRK